MMKIAKTRDVKYDDIVEEYFRINFLLVDSDSVWSSMVLIVERWNFGSISALQLN